MRSVTVVAGLALAAALGAGGCLVDVSEVADPAPAFREAHAQAARVEGHRGPARRLNVLAYEPDERELTRIRLPLSVARKAARDGGPDGDTPAEARLRRRLRKADLDKAELGVLLEVEERDGERVLIWLD